MSLRIKLPKAAESSELPPARRKSAKRIVSPVEDDVTEESGPPLKRSRIHRSPDGSEEDHQDGDSDSPVESRQPTRVLPASNARSKPQNKKKRSKVVLSDPESEDFDPNDEESESELQMLVDEDEYMSEPKHPAKRAGGGKGKGANGGAKGKRKPEVKETTARDERKRTAEPGESAAAVSAKRQRKPSTKAADVILDVVGDTEPATASQTPTEDPLPTPVQPKKKLPAIKKNKPPTTASSGSALPSSGTAGLSTTSAPPKPLAISTARPEEESKLPPPVVGAVGARKAATVVSADVDLSNPTMYAQLFKSGGGSTPSGFTRREKDEERRKELNRLREEAKARRMNDTTPTFDLQGQMDKITRYEERLRLAKSPSVYPNFLAGALKQLQTGKRCLAGVNPEPREEGEM